MKQSAGILVYKKEGAGIKVLLAHPSGPFWAKQDTWSIPKGELDEGEDHIKAAKREFEEELGVKPPEGKLIDLGSTKQSGNKTNYIWAVEGDIDTNTLQFNSTFTIEWPPGSGNMREFPENDRAEWFNLSTAKTKLFKAQILFIDRLAERLGVTLQESQTFENSQQTLLQ